MPAMPIPNITGGAATAVSGAQDQNSNMSFGGLDYNNGLPTWALITLVVVVVAGVVVYSLK